MSRKTTTRRHRRCLPAVTRKQMRTRVRDLQDDLRQAQHQLEGAGFLVEGQRQRIEELKAKVAKQAADAVDVSVLRKQLAAAEARNQALQADATSMVARLQNLEAITVPPMVRDTTDPQDQGTEPLYVQTLRDLEADRERTLTMPVVRPLAEALGVAS